MAKKNQMWTYMFEDVNLYNVDADLCLNLTGGNIYSRTEVNLYHCGDRQPQW